jgi:hypothetical protein
MNAAHAFLRPFSQLLYPAVVWCPRLEGDVVEFVAEVPRHRRWGFGEGDHRFRARTVVTIEAIVRTRDIRQLVSVLAHDTWKALMRTVLS